MARLLSSSRGQPLQGARGRRKASTSEYGKEMILTIGATRARATFQNGVCGKCSRYMICQRAMVRRSAPKRLDSSRTRRGDGPCRIALIRMTTALK
jgi:hypothetical protein